MRAVPTVVGNAYYNRQEGDGQMSRTAISAGLLATGRGHMHRGLLVTVVATIAWGFASWLVAEKLCFEQTSRLIEHERGTASASAASLAANVGFTLAQMRNIPKVLARQPEIEQLLSRTGPDVQRSDLPPPLLRKTLEKQNDLAQISKRLEGMVAELSIDQIWVMNAAGDCIASGGFPPTGPATGVNYVDREYFRMAKREGTGRQFAVGRTTNSPGIFYSAAVIAGQRVLGVIAVKIDVERLSRLVSDSNTFITDEYGVVIIAGDSSLIMKAVPNPWVSRLSESEQQDRYKRHDFARLMIDPFEVDGFNLYRLEGRGTPMLKASSGKQGDLLNIWVFRDVSEVWRIQRERLWVFLVLLLGGASLIACVSAGFNYLRRGKEHQGEIARVNAELVKLTEELLRQTRVDSLTGCSNRRYFLEELENELKRSSRFCLSCSLALIDLDHFKEVNDRYGHATGDILLKHFVQTVSQCLRASDILGRLGGEEFAVLLPQTTLLGAGELAERVRTAVEHSNALCGPLEIRFTISIGVEQWWGGEDSVESFVARADNAMYAAKHGGRNRVHCASGSRLPGSL